MLPPLAPRFLAQAELRLAIQPEPAGLLFLLLERLRLEPPSLKAFRQYADVLRAQQVFSLQHLGQREPQQLPDAQQRRQSQEPSLQRHPPAAARQSPERWAAEL